MQKHTSTDGTTGEAQGSEASRTSSLPILYVKSGCPWCHEVVDFLMSKGIGYEERNVSRDSDAMAEMRRKSGQTSAPTMDWNGKILADFGVDELKPFLRQQNVKFEDS